MSVRFIFFQEKVPEMYRGQINGVQNGLNYAMDTLKFALVVTLPNNETFGFLIIASVSAISLGGCCYTYYATTTKDYKSESGTETNPTDAEPRIVMSQLQRDSATSDSDETFDP